MQDGSQDVCQHRIKTNILRQLFHIFQVETRRKWVPGIASGQLWHICTISILKQDKFESSGNAQLFWEKKSVSLCWKIWGICILECRNHPQWIHASGYNNWNEYLLWHFVMPASGYPQEENWASLKRCNSGQCNATQHTGRTISVGISTSWQSTMQS